jgi:bifunctional non-homologous end joining protein LigD
MFPDVAAALQAALKHPGVLDGEIVCFDDEGRTSFRALQQRFHLADPEENRSRGRQYPASISLFDLLWLDGHDITGEPLLARKKGCVAR